MNKTDYPLWNFVDFSPPFSPTVDPLMADKLARIMRSPVIRTAQILGFPIYGDAEACLRAKAIFLTTDDDICILHPVNDDEDEMVLRLSYDNVEILYRLKND